MSKRARAAWVAVFTLWCSTSVEAAEPAGTPAGLVQAQLAAARRQDVDGFLAGLTSSSRQALTEAIARRAALDESQRHFREALDQKFGAGPVMLVEPPEDIRTALSRLAAAEVVGQTKNPDGTVGLRVRTSIKGTDGKIVVRDEVLVARQENGAWKLVLGFTDGKFATQAYAVTRRMTERVRDGEFKDRVTAMIALDNGLSGNKSAEKTTVSP
jgi:hypothetical protein